MIDTIKELNKIKSLNKPDAARAASAFIGERLDRELLISSPNIFDLFKDIINPTEDLLDDLRKTDWYDEYVEYNGYKIIKLFKVKPFTELTYYEQVAILTEFKEFNISEDPTKVRDIFLNILESEVVEILKLATANYIYHNGLSKNVISFTDIPELLLDDTEVLACLVLMNLSDSIFITDKIKEDESFIDCISYISRLVFNLPIDLELNKNSIR
ncbi:MAG: hypothetical protein JTJ30_05270 [Catenibacterium mitsuokai]|nr:hypothetical protein [Catenibacterium mitsuokai]MBN2931387.1 hypothetical protein [Catenibacterium mitsuokai]